MFPSRDHSDDLDHNKRRVLVVDDEPTLRIGFTYALASPALIVESVANGRQALERIAAVSFDVVILDLRMPDLDGTGVIGALRGEGNLIPIILCSAAFHARAALWAIRHGVVDFLLKPVRPVDLRQVIEFVIRPENRPLPMAMKAARMGENGEAIRILENQTNPSRQAIHWLETFKFLRDADLNLDAAKCEERIRESLPILAFNSSGTS